MDQGLIMLCLRPHYIEYRICNDSDLFSIFFQWFISNGMVCEKLHLNHERHEIHERDVGILSSWRIVK